MPSRFSIKRSVEFVETDMAGIMHFSNYFRWMEACETAFYQSLGLPMISFLPGQAVGWPRVNVTCEFTAPLRFGEEAEVRLEIRRLGEKSVTYGFEFAKKDEVIAKGQVTAVCIRPQPDGGMVSAAIPEQVRNKLADFVA